MAGVRAQSDYSTPYSFSTLAGVSSIGSTDGIGSAARFYGPHAVAVDAAGNVFVTDTGNHTIRRIAPLGEVSTLAGEPGIEGSSDGVGHIARFSYPEGIAIDAAGNLYVADNGNHTIRKITPAGLVSTLAGMAGSQGSADGVGNAARFNFPTGVAVDRSGNVYATDTGNHTVRKIAPGGVVSTLAGLAGNAGYDDGVGDGARFWHPGVVAMDRSDNLYMITRGPVSNARNRIESLRKITLAGVVTTLASGHVSVLEFESTSVHGMAFDSAGNRLETKGHAIQRTSADGTTTTIAGSPPVGYEGGYADGPAGLAKFDLPRGLTVDVTGNIIVADTDNNVVRKVSLGGEVITLAGMPVPIARGSADGVGGAARFHSPAGIGIAPTGEIYLADPGNYTVREITLQGSVTTLAGTAGRFGTTDGTGGAAQFRYPTGIAVDLQGNVFVADEFFSIRKIATDGSVVTLVAAYNGRSVAVDVNGDLYVVVRGVVRKITRAGVVIDLAGQEFQFGSADGAGANARFSGDGGITVDPAGFLYVADTLNHTIRKITPSGMVTTFAGSADIPGYADGVGSDARFYWPNEVAADAAGNLYVADTFNQAIRKITPTGVVSTAAGLVDSPGSTDGTGSRARFYYPQGIAVDTAGNLYVTSSTTVRKGRLAAIPVITVQPKSVSAATGTSVKFSVTAVGVPEPSYQWYFNGNPINGATGDSLTAMVGPAAVGDYTVVVANDLGSATSRKATLAIVQAPAGSSSSGSRGGGGALGIWFLAVVTALAAVHCLKFQSIFG